MFSCKHLDTFLDDYLAGRLHWAVRVRFRAHLMLCPPCRRYLDQYKRTMEATRHAGTAPVEQSPMPATMVRDIASIMRQQCSTGGDPRSALPPDER